MLVVILEMGCFLFQWTRYRKYKWSRNVTRWFFFFFLSFEYAVGEDTHCTHSGLERIKKSHALYSARMRNNNRPLNRTSGWKLLTPKFCTKIYGKCTRNSYGGTQNDTETALLSTNLALLCTRNYTFEPPA